MRRFYFVVSLLLFCWPQPAAFSQESSVLRIGVALPTSSADAATDAQVRDQLVKLLNQHKNDKKLKAPLEAIALDSPPGGRAVTEARNRNCEYVLYTRVKGVESGSEYQPAYSEWGISTRPVVKARVEYLLRRLSDGVSYASGTATSDEVVSDQAALTGAVDRVATAVCSDLKTGGNGGRKQLKGCRREAITPVAKPDAATGVSFCQWLPSDIPHADALRGVCKYAMTLPEKMPNFVCRQETQRFEGRNSVPQDLITASVRYEDGDESYSDLKQNGKPVAEGAARAAGLWSSGQFKGDLRGVFHSANAAEFDYFGEDEAEGHKAWVFTFEIEHQREPVWQLRGKDEVLAPAYGGEIWVDEKRGEVIRFRLTAKDLPPAFPIQSAEIQTDYGAVAFGDGTEFVLPVDSSVATRYQGAQPTKNVVRFSGCHKFAAKTRILTGAPRKAPEGGAVAQVNDDSAIRELEQNETIYAIFRDQAIREDEMLMAWEQQQDVNVATVAVYRRIAAMNAQLARQEALAAQKAQADTVSDATATVKVNVRLVPVSVVTRDAKGHAVGTLVKDDFALFDEKRLQVISRFTLEKKQTSPGATSTAAGGSRPVAVENSVAYVFDDLHASLEDLTNATQAAAKHLGELRAQDRAALFTISGKTPVDFTADRGQLLSALKTLKPRTHPGWDCPQITYYMADLIVNRADVAASEIAVAEAKQCGGEAPGGRPTGFAEKLAISRALEVALAGRVDSDRTLQMLAEIIQRTAAMPGRKTIVLVSPGFLTVAPDAQDRAMALIDNAVQANVVVNVLDVTGLTTSVEASPMDGPETAARNEVMASLAYGTGGTFFHNNNDLNEGFRQTGDAPEYIYVLGFSPEKLDGKFHKLKVALNTKEKLSVQARPGYYATKAESQ